MFTDASFYDKTGAAAWALWAKSERGTHKAQGLIRRRVVNSSEAELAALANGMDSLCRSKIILAGDELLVQADNLHALGCVAPEGKRPTMSPFMCEISDHIANLISGHGLTVRTRHVKGHSGQGEPRLWVHSDCDRRCRNLARQEHARRLASNHPIPPSMMPC